MYKKLIFVFKKMTSQQNSCGNNENDEQSQINWMNDEHNEDTVAEQLWINEPSHLFTEDNWMNFVPQSGMTYNETMNAIMRFSIYMFLILFLINGRFRHIFWPLFTFLFTFAIDRFANHDSIEAEMRKIKNIEEKTKPTLDNPFMNTLLPEVGIEKKRPEAVDAQEHPEVKKNIEYWFNYNLFKDTDDIYNRRNSQQQFFTMPNTNEYGVSNGDTLKFANWLYNPGKPSCKEDSQNCIGSYNKSYSDFYANKAQRQFIRGFDIQED